MGITVFHRGVNGIFTLMEHYTA